jgi:hypothetical protein
MYDVGGMACSFRILKLGFVIIKRKSHDKIIFVIMNVK